MNLILIAAIGLAGIVVMLVLLSFIKKDGKYAKFGVNIKRTHCPECDLIQPIARKPANRRQAMYGGHTCKGCGTEMDKYGTKIDVD